MAEGFEIPPLALVFLTDRELDGLKACSREYKRRISTMQFRIAALHIAEMKELLQERLRHQASHSAAFSLVEMD